MALYLASITCLLDATGTHTVLGMGEHGNNNGPFGLYLQRMNNPVGGVATSFGQNYSGTLPSGASTVDTNPRYNYDQALKVANSVYFVTHQQAEVGEVSRVARRYRRAAPGTGYPARLSWNSSSSVAKLGI